MHLSSRVSSRQLQFSAAGPERNAVAKQPTALIAARDACRVRRTHQSAIRARSAVTFRQGADARRDQPRHQRGRISRAREQRVVRLSSTGRPRKYDRRYRSWFCASVRSTGACIRASCGPYSRPWSKGCGSLVVNFGPKTAVPAPWPDGAVDERPSMAGIFPGPGVRRITPVLNLRGSL
jgi:hypothetical protein